METASRLLPLLLIFRNSLSEVFANADSHIPAYIFLYITSRDFVDALATLFPFHKQYSVPADIKAFLRDLRWPGTLGI
jgi:hypothetical protein